MSNLDFTSAIEAEREAELKTLLLKGAYEKWLSDNSSGTTLYEHAEDLARTVRGINNGAISAKIPDKIPDWEDNGATSAKGDD